MFIEDQKQTIAFRNDIRPKPLILRSFFSERFYRGKGRMTGINRERKEERKEVTAQLKSKTHCFSGDAEASRKEV